MKSKIAPIVLFAIVLTVIFFGIKVYRNPNSLKWLTESPTDLIPIEGRPGEYRVRGVEPESVNGIQNSQTPAFVQQPQIDPVYDQTIQRGVITNFPVGVWVTVYKNFIPGTSVLTSFDTDAELVMYKVRLGGVVMTNYASCHPETVRGKNSSAKAKMDVMSNSLEVQMLPGQQYNTFAAVWWRE